MALPNKTKVTNDPSSTPTISAVVIARNEAEMIANCLDTLRWCDEVVVIDNGSDDATAEIAQTWGARAISFQADSFAQLRNKALKHVKTDWLIYIDADERVTPALSREIMVQIETTQANAGRIKRHNIMYGHRVEHGGWQDDWVTRIFRRQGFDGWTGTIHESPQVTGDVFSLHHHLWHFTHQNTRKNLLKSAEWTPMEAALLADARTKPVTPLTLVRKTVMEVIRRLVFKKGYRDGMVGWVEALVQGMNRLMVYVQVWELQQQPPLADRYQQYEQQIADEWHQADQLERSA